MESKERILSPCSADGRMHDLQTELLAAVRRYEAARTYYSSADREFAQRRLLFRRKHYVSTQLFRLRR